MASTGKPGRQHYASEEPPNVPGQKASFVSLRELTGPGDIASSHILVLESTSLFGSKQMICFIVYTSKLMKRKAYVYT